MAVDRGGSFLTKVSACRKQRSCFFLVSTRKLAVKGSSVDVLCTVRIIAFPREADQEKCFTWVSYVVKYYNPFQVSEKEALCLHSGGQSLQHGGSQGSGCCQDLSVSHLCCRQHLSLLPAKSGGSDCLTSLYPPIEPCGKASVKASSPTLERRLCLCVGLRSAVMVRSREL